MSALGQAGDGGKGVYADKIVGEKRCPESGQNVKGRFSVEMDFQKNVIYHRIIES